MAQNKAKYIKKIILPKLRKNCQTPSLQMGSQKISVVCLSVHLSLSLRQLVTFFSELSQCVLLFFLHDDILPCITKSDKSGFCKSVLYIIG